MTPAQAKDAFILAAMFAEVAEQRYESALDEVLRARSRLESARADLDAALDLAEDAGKLVASVEPETAAAAVYDPITWNRERAA